MENKIAQALVDTDVIIRLLTGDDLKKQQASAQLFEKVEQEKIILSAPDTVIADAIYVLSSPRLYDIPRAKIRDLLAPLLRLTHFKVDNKQTVLSALDFYTSSTIDFGDAMVAAMTLGSRTKSVYSYDHDYDKIPNITRLEP